MLIGGVHGDEPEGVALVQSTLNWLQQAPPIEGQKVTPSWIIIPCINPDGFLSNQRGNGHGVDLNRNWPSQNWKANEVKDRYYPGPYAGSEPEIQALVELIDTCGPRLLIHCHSWKPCIVCTGAPGLPYAKALSQSSGYPIVDEIGYPTPGSLSHYGWSDQQIPVICIEETEKTPAEEIWAHFSKGIKDIFCENLPSI